MGELSACAAIKSVFRRLQAEGLVGLDSSVLAACAGPPERELFPSMGYRNVTITNLGKRLSTGAFKPYAWAYQNAQNLSYPDGSFDFAFVSDGLHHCASPHRGLLEMYRVARRGIILFEGRHSLLVRLSVRADITAAYEVSAVAGNQGRYGGVDAPTSPTAGRSAN